MRLIVPIIKTALGVLIIGCTMYYEQQFYIGIGICACYLMALIGLILPDISDRITDFLGKWQGYWIFIGSCLFFTTWAHLGIGLRAIHDNNQVRVVSAFYPLGKTLDFGCKIDTLHHIGRCYKQDTKYYVNYEDMYLLSSSRHNTLFSNHAIVAQGTEFQFHERDFGHGFLHICSYTDTTGVKRVIDMYGANILDSSYEPIVIDTYSSMY